MGLSLKQIDRAKHLKNTMVYDVILGNYKSFKKSHQEYASLAVQDFDKTKTITVPKISVPIFSKQGFNIMYVMIRNFFRIKTPDEKLLEQMAKAEKKQQALNKFM